MIILNGTSTMMIKLYNNDVTTTLRCYNISINIIVGQVLLLIMVVMM